jgi:prepilin-type N-terminal cleavage/methylation domain-containing protein
MGAAMKSNLTKARPSQAGFTLIEAMIAMAVMTVGLLAVIASLSFAMAAVQNGENDLIARQKALEAMESIYTARNSQQPGFSFGSINNVSSGGIFKNGANPLLCAGPDGMVGTTDDVPCKTAAGATCPDSGVECMVLPGPDGILGTADDVTMSLGNFTRTITISQVLLPDGTVNENMVAVTVTVSYAANGGTRAYTTNGLISSYY